MGGTPMTARDDRLARTLARRHTPEWQAGGDALAAERDRAEAKNRLVTRQRAALAADDRRRARIDNDPARFDRAVTRLRNLFDACLADAADDSGEHPDVIAHDIWTSVRLDAPTAKVAAEVARQLGFDR